MTHQEQMDKWRAAVQNPETIRRHLAAVRAARCKKIRCKETGVVYESQADFAREFKVSYMMVNAVIRGRKHSVHGMTLEFV